MKDRALDYLNWLLESYIPVMGTGKGIEPDCIAEAKQCMEDLRLIKNVLDHVDNGSCSRADGLKIIKRIANRGTWDDNE